MTRETHRPDIHHNGYSLKGLRAINFFLGKNGCGKSVMLRAFRKQHSVPSGYSRVHYIVPERGGEIRQESGISDAIRQNDKWINSNREQNELREFRIHSVALFTNFEIRFLRGLEDKFRVGAYPDKLFDNYYSQLNGLLDQIVAVRDNNKTIRFESKDEPPKTIEGDVLSTGEKEVITIGMESIVFANETEEGQNSLLLLDEPDAHLHPDLQDRLAKFLAALSEEHGITIIIVTHSTNLVACLRERSDVSVAFMRSGQTDFIFQGLSDQIKTVLPIFGAHPLSNLFNESPPLLIEGEDDERIWQTAIRASKGRIRLFPCVCGDVDRIHAYERTATEIIDALYESAKAFSLRDRDDKTEHIAKEGAVTRLRLACRTAENLILSDEALSVAKTGWSDLENGIQKWMSDNPNHQHFQYMTSFRDSGFNRKDANIKKIRNDLLGIIGTTKSWEVLVGQTIGRLSESQLDHKVSNSIANFLGKNVIDCLLSGLKSDTDCD